MFSGNLFKDTSNGSSGSYGSNGSSGRSGSSSLNSLSNENRDIVVKNAEVFNIRDNSFTYKEAKAVCKAYDSKLATLDQIIDAYKKGANWCSYGWSADQMALYPIQEDYWKELQEYPSRKRECGDIGVNGGYFSNPNYKFGVNCFGKKPEPKNNEKDMGKVSYYLSNNEVLTNKYKGVIDKIRISPFSHKEWAQK